MFNKTKTDNIKDEMLKKQEQEQKEINDMNIACKQIFSDANGYFFLKYLKKICLWDKQDVNVNPEILAYEKGRRDIWLVLRTFIPKEVLAQIEIYDTRKE